MLNAIGMIEMTSVGIGLLVQDTMLKAADVKLIMARTVCSGKYIIVVGGNVASVEAAVSTGLETAEGGVIDHMTIANVHEDVFKALGQAVQINGQDTPSSVGIVESFSATSALEAADAAAKAAGVTLVRIHLAMALGGKAFLVMTGSVADCQSGVDTAAAVVKAKGLLVSAVVIPRPSPQILQEYI